MDAEAETGTEATPVVLAEQNVDEAVPTSGSDTASPSTPIETMDAKPLTPTEQTADEPSTAIESSVPLTAEPGTEQLDAQEPEAMDVEVEPYILSTPPIEGEGAATVAEPVIEDVPTLTPRSRISWV